MSILGGSPLGLIGVKSSPVQGTGMSTFNGGASRNINVNMYNGGRNENVNKKGAESLLSGRATIAPYSNIGSIGNDNGTGQNMDKTKYPGVNKNTLHNNDVYDTSLLNIIERLSNTVAAIRPGDFAYLKDVGVYPNNRLMIARRFLSPHSDNIYGKSKGISSIPMAVMISWKAQDDDFVEISFGEEWIPANADFTNVMNSLGEDFGMSGKLSLGNMANSAFNITSLPGFTETLQRKLLTKMGILDNGGDEKSLPSGNPNLIKVAKRRKNVPYTEAGSGLKCTVNIKMTCEWEQKFISGIDPTVVFQDLLATILRFGTSRSDFYGLSPTFEKNVETWVNNPETFAKDFIGYITEALSTMAKDIKIAIEGFFGKDSANKEPTPAEVTQKKNDAISAAKAQFDNLLTNIGTTLKKTVQKYRLEIEGIARALSGMPSTPWHITIGNPLRPVFCAGDMYMSDDMTLKLGPNLAFNDLPSSITAEFTLTNARPWGLQEILGKFNAGSLRVSNGLKDQNSLNPNETLQNGKTGDGDLINGLSGTASSTVSPSVAGNSGQSPTSQVTNNATQKLSVSNVGVINVGVQTETQAKYAASLKDNPSILNGFNTTNSTIPYNSDITLKDVSSSPVVNSVTGGSPILSGLSTTKKGTSGEQIVKDSTSTIAVTLLA